MKTGLVLSGGGIRGVAHIGLLKIIAEQNIKIDAIAGTSAGAIIAAMYAAGNSWDVILDFFINTSVFEISKYAHGKPGFIDTAKFEKNLKVYFPNDSFETLTIPLTITASDIQNGNLKVFNTGPLIHPVLASSAFPGVFTPVAIDGVYYFDGGVIDDFPVEYLLDSSDFIVGSYANPLSEVSMESLKYSYQVVNRAYEINLHSQLLSKSQLCDIFICPEALSQYGTFSMNSAPEIFAIGYQEAQKELVNYKERLRDKRSGIL